MTMLEYTLDDHVAILTMNSGENRFNSGFIAEFHQVLNEIEDRTDARVLIVRSAHEKIWSNGIDLEWAVPLALNDPEAAKKFPYELTGLYKHILTYPLITIAAINGHAFAGGAIMAFSFDFRFMRTQRGFLCLPEVDIGIPLFPSMTAISQKAVPWPKYLEMLFTAARLTAEDCERHQIILKACPIETLMSEALTWAKAHQKNRETIRSMKQITYQYIVDIMEKDDPVWLSQGKTGLG